MRHRPRLRSAVFCAALALTAACADSTSTGVPAPLEPGSPAQLRLTCSADVARGTVHCAAPGGAAGLRADRIMGQGSGMSVVSGNVAVAADTFAFDLAAANGLSYPVGTSDGVSADPNGIRVFVVDGIHTTQGTGSVTVANADGVGTFTASNQPYFAYPGILQPDSTTAAHRWKFRFDPDVVAFTFSLYLSVPVPPGGGGVWMTVLLPAANAVVPDSVVVRVRIDSASAPIASVHASAAGRRVRLLPVSPGVVQGTLSLAGLPVQTLQLVVDAGTIRGDTGSVTRTITKDAPPRVTMTGPRTDYVASPFVRIDADCVDDDPAGCTKMVAMLVLAETGRQLATRTGGGIHESFDLSTNEETAPTIIVTGYDSRGAITEARADIIVESEASVARVDSGGVMAMDLDSTRLLFIDEMTGIWTSQRTGGARTLLSGAPAGFSPQAYQYSYSSGWLYPLGAIFVADRSNATVYDWRAGTLTDLGQASPSYSLRKEGSWAIWVYGTGIYRRDLAAGTTLTVSTTDSHGDGDVAPNGDVVFSGTGREIYRFRDGVTTPLTADLDSAHWNLTPVTDGTNVLFYSTDQHGSTTTAQPGRVALWNAGTVTRLSTVAGTYLTPRDYAASGGWIAYTVVDGAGLKQVRTRAPDGTDRLATLFSGSNNTIVELAGDGALVYRNDQGLYAVRAPYTGTPTRLGGTYTRAIFRGGDLFLFVGNSVFQATY